MAGNFYLKDLTKNLIYFLLFLFSLGVFPIANSKVTEEISGTHYKFEGYYVLEHDALQACNDFTVSHGYIGSWCNKVGSSFYAGWLWSKYNVTAVPFSFGIFYFNLNCPNGIQLDNDTGSCVSYAENINLGSPQICIGNPINAATGNKYAEEQDIAFSDGLGFSRHYNSASVSNNASIGFGWSHTYQRSLFINADTVIFARPDGRVANFRFTGNLWVNQQAGGDILVQLSDIDGNSAG